MKKMLLFILLICSITYAQTGQKLLLLGGDLQTETRVYLSSLTTPLSKAQVTRIDKFVKMVKDSLQISSLSSKFDGMYLLANETSEAGLKNLVKRSHDATAVNSPTFTQWEGFTGNGMSSYINTNYNPATNAVVYNQNSASVGIYSRSSSGNNGADYGVKASTDNPRSEISLSYSGTILYGTINSVGIIGRFAWSNTDSRGFYISNRSTSADGQLYKNGVFATTLTQSSAMPNYNYYISAVNIEGTANAFQNRQYSFWFAGASLTASEASKLTNCVEWYLDQLGKGVIP